METFRHGLIINVVTAICLVGIVSVGRREGDEVILAVDDNGRGLPRQGRERLTDPYVTTRVKGTGLGLAIVKKIMDDHGGKLQLLDGDKGGASVRLTFPAEIVLADPALKSVQA